MTEKIKILGIPGSIRKKSYNRYLLEAAKELKPENVEISIFDIGEIPMYDGDLDRDGGPEPVNKFRSAIADADGILISTPEYNYSIPGVLKNAVDWASRPARESVLNMKPLAVMGTTGGMYGTIRAQIHMRQIAQSVNMMDMKRPELMIPKEQEKFDADGKLTDEAAREHLKKFMLAFENWIKIFKD